MGEFGDKFRKEREKKGISLDDVSNVTKIASRMLQAIEQEHFDQLPGGVFNKGFIRAYAKHLGLNDEEAVTDYLVALRQAQVDAHEVWDPVQPPAQEKRSPGPYAKPTLHAHPPVQVEEELPELQLPRAEDVRPPRKGFTVKSDRGFPWGIAAAAALVIILAAVLWSRHSRATHIASASNNPPAVPTAQAASPAVTPTENKPSAMPAVNATPSSNPNLSAPPPSAPATSPAKSEIKKDVKTDVNTSDTNPGAREEKKGSDVTIRTFPAAPAAASPVTPVAPMTLVIRATENSWISVTADGQPVSQETLIAPAHASIRATREITVRVGNAAGVTFLWNNQEIPAQGAEAEVKTFTFDQSGLKVQ